MSRAAGDTWNLPDELAGPWLRAAHLGRRLKVPAGKQLYTQGESSRLFYFILSGQVQVSIIRADGHEVILEIMGHGALCGEGAAFDGIPRLSTATVLKDAEVLRFNANDLPETFRQDPGLAISLLRIISLKQRILASRLESAYSPSAEVRIREFLLRLNENYAVTTAAGSLIPIYLTHEQIGAITGTSRVTVTRTLNRYKKAGAIKVEQGRISILKSDALQSLTP